MLTWDILIGSFHLIGILTHSLSLSHSLFSPKQNFPYTLSHPLLVTPDAVSTLLANPSLGVVGEAGAPRFGGKAGNAAVVDEDEVVGVGEGDGVDLNEFNGGNERRISDEAVEAEIEGGGGVGERGEEVAISAFVGNGISPRSALVEDDGGGECDVEGGRTELGIHKRANQLHFIPWYELIRNLLPF